MKDLIYFALLRRFKTKTFRLLAILALALSLLFCFADKVILALVPDLFDPHTVNLEVENPSLFEHLLPEELVLGKPADITIYQEGASFSIHSKIHLHSGQQEALSYLCTTYYQKQVESSLDLNVQQALAEAHVKSLDFVLPKDNQVVENQNNLFFLITSIYFTMVGFMGILASEVVSEKISNILEMVATSVSLKTHYYSKIIIGFLTMLVQLSVFCGVFIFSGLVRWAVDGGTGLLSFLAKTQIVSLEANSFSDLFHLFFGSQANGWNLLLALIFLFIGILTIQMVLVVLTVKVVTVEEAGALQGPCYLVMMVLYYASLFLNNPGSMNQGLGRILSFLPVTSMLFMPSRILVYQVSSLEIILALALVSLSLIILIAYGEDYYRENVLNNQRREKKRSTCFD